MQRHIRLIAFVVVLTALGYGLWPFLEEHVSLLRHYLVHFRIYSHDNPLMGYVLFASVVSLTILIGLPLTTVWMIAAGLFYEFWEGAAVITLSRLLAAVVAFLLARRMLTGEHAPEAEPHRLPILRNLEEHPNLGLFIARLTPIPDVVVNYSSAAAPISHMDYLVVSLLGMLPYTLFFVWTGEQLGTISGLLNWMQ